MDDEVRELLTPESSVCKFVSFCVIKICNWSCSGSAISNIELLY